MDGKKLRTANSSGNLSLSSTGRRSSIDSTHSSAGKSTRSKLSRFLPSRSRRRSSAQADPKRRLNKVESGAVKQEIDPKDLNLVDSGDEDLVTFDDEDSSKLTPSRPHLSPHPSHAGYLTLSSPLIPSETVPAAAQEQGTPGASNQSALAAPASAERSPSPSGKLREAFAPSKKSTPPGISAPEFARTSSGGVGRIGTLFGGRIRKNDSKDSKDSKESKESSSVEESTPVRLIEDKPLSQEPQEATPSPKKVVPALRTILSTPPAGSGPQTFVTPPTPVDNHSDPEFGCTAVKPAIRRSSASEVDLTSGDLGHRRTRSALTSSKLSQSIVPLTPAVEEIKTPGGTLQAGPSGGFFAGVLSAAQNAANTLSNSISVSAKSKTPQPQNGADHGVEEVILSTKSVSSDADTKSNHSKKPAIETLGLGNLSLTHLGIVDSKSSTPNSSHMNLMDTANQSSIAAAGAAAKKEDTAASRAVSKAYEKPNCEKSPPSPETNRTVVADDSSVIRQSIEPENGTIKRASSVRSKLSNGRRRRTRGSSVNTPSFPTTARFTAAPPKRNRDFHNTFKSVPEDDQLIEDYAAALQKEILLQGRLYISEGHVCFWSNIFGYVTTLIISFDEIISVEKKSTAMIFQNAIVIQTLHARNVFASLLNRDATYELIISIWKVNNPHLRSSLNGNPVEGAGTGDKTEKVADVDDESASEEIYDEDDEVDEDNDGESYAEAIEQSAASSDDNAIKQVNRKVSSNVAAALTASSPKSPEAAEAAAASSGSKTDFPGPATHDPTECGDQASHFEKLLLDSTIPAPLGKVFSLVFGKVSPTFMRKFLTESEKAWDFAVEENDVGLSMDQKTRKFQYIRPLAGNPLGPKQTKCIITETLEQLDYEKAISVTCNTSNPDVPSGGSFVVKTRYCLMWAAGNSTRMLITYTVQWTGRSIIKGAVESGVASGQLAYAKALTSFLTAATEKNTKAKGLKKGGSRRKRNADTSQSPEPPIQNSSIQESNWGMFEPLHPIADIINALAPPSSIVIGILFATILGLLFRSPSRSGYGGHRLPGMYGPAYYENVWRGEESELWNWIEERVGIWEAIKSPDLKDIISKKEKKASSEVDNLLGLGEQEILEAIRVTKTRLGTLEQAVLEKRKKREQE